jgi:hypothetical protein
LADFASAFLKDEEATLVVETTLSFFEWVLSDTDRCLTTVSGLLEDNWVWDGLGVMEFSSTSVIFGDMAFVEKLPFSSGVSDIGSVDTLETTLGFRLGRLARLLKEVLLDGKPMLLSVPTGEVISKLSAEDSVANEVLLPLEEQAAVEFSLSLLQAFLFFFWYFLLFDFGFSVTTFSLVSSLVCVSAGTAEVTSLPGLVADVPS